MVEKLNKNKHWRLNGDINSVWEKVIKTIKIIAQQKMLKIPVLIYAKKVDNKQIFCIQKCIEKYTLIQKIRNLGKTYERVLKKKGFHWCT